MDGAYVCLDMDGCGLASIYGLDRIGWIYQTSWSKLQIQENLRFFDVFSHRPFPPSCRLKGIIHFHIYNELCFYWSSHNLQIFLRLPDKLIFVRLIFNIGFSISVAEKKKIAFSSHDSNTNNQIQSNMARAR